MQGIGTLASKFKESTTQELKHANIIADRLSSKAPSKTEEWSRVSIMDEMK